MLARFGIPTEPFDPKKHDKENPPGRPRFVRIPIPTEEDIKAEAERRAAFVREHQQDNFFKRIIVPCKPRTKSTIFLAGLKLKPPRPWWVPASNPSTPPVPTASPVQPAAPVPKPTRSVLEGFAPLPRLVRPAPVVQPAAPVSKPTRSVLEGFAPLPRLVRPAPAVLPVVSVPKPAAALVSGLLLLLTLGSALLCGLHPHPCCCQKQHDGIRCATCPSSFRDSHCLLTLPPFLCSLLPMCLFKPCLWSRPSFLP